MSYWPRSRFATESDRFHFHVQKTEGGCWLWMGHRSQQGYGQAWWHGGNRLAHRVAWEIATGEWPARTTHVCHRCDNPPCVNPAHLFLGTALDNIRDMIAKGRKVVHNRSITHCKRGHAFTPENTSLEDGARRCRACVYLRRPLKGRLRSHCKRGHPFSRGNTIIGRTDAGLVVRRCRICRQLSSPQSRSGETGISRTLRRVLQRATRCVYCGRVFDRDETVHADHVVPVCQGGTSADANVVAACARCNRKKGGRRPEEAGMRRVV